MIGKIMDAALMLWQSFSSMERAVVVAWATSLLLARILNATLRARERREQQLADYLVYRLRAERETQTA